MRVARRREEQGVGRPALGRGFGCKLLRDPAIAKLAHLPSGASKVFPCGGRRKVFLPGILEWLRGGRGSRLQSKRLILHVLSLAAFGRVPGRHADGPEWIFAPAREPTIEIAVVPGSIRI
jgi:hypothetical protein